MDGTTFRILDALSRNLGSQISINKLTKEIEELRGSAYYANVYNRVRSLSKEGIVSLTRAGKSSFVSLNFGSYLTMDLLTEMELTRKRELLKTRKELQFLLADIEEHFKDRRLTVSICLTSPEKNVKLNRAELLILLQAGDNGKRDGMREMHSTITSLQRTHNIRLDYLALGREEFHELLRSEERNPLKEMLADKIAFFNPQGFWSQIRDAIAHGMLIRFGREETHPAKVAERDLVYNLARFGYTEMGSETETGENTSVEYIITSLMVKGNSRRVEAVPVILAKNRVNYSLLIFLSQKYGVSDRLLGLLKALNKIKPEKPRRETIEILEAMNVKELEAHEASIRQRLRLYNAIG